MIYVERREVEKESHMSRDIHTKKTMQEVMGLREESASSQILEAATKSISTHLRL